MKYEYKIGYMQKHVELRYTYKHDFKGQL